ncbi:MAG TPA: phosphohydrolase [Myxococcales bacterium]|nr:phosphohydrolase [Myxococcales bacterium]
MESWILTSTGRKFCPFSPDMDAVAIEDIAHSLSMQCRYNGHCRVFYSVAEHSVRVSRILPDVYALWGLLHDAAEASLSDMPRPVKYQLTAFLEYEDALLKQLAAHFGLSWPMPDAVKEADDILLVTELRDIMPPSPRLKEFGVEPLEERIVETLLPQEAKALFLERFGELAG